MILFAFSCSILNITLAISTRFLKYVEGYVAHAWRLCWLWVKDKRCLMFGGSVLVRWFCLATPLPIARCLFRKRLPWRKSIKSGHSKAEKKKKKNPCCAAGGNSAEFQWLWVIHCMTSAWAHRCSGGCRFHGQLRSPVCFQPAELLSVLHITLQYSQYR